MHDEAACWNFLAGNPLFENKPAAIPLFLQVFTMSSVATSGRWTQFAGRVDAAAIERTNKAAHVGSGSEGHKTSRTTDNTPTMKSPTKKR